MGSAWKVGGGGELCVCARRALPGTLNRRAVVGEEWRWEVENGETLWRPRAQRRVDDEL